MRKNQASAGASASQFKGETIRSSSIECETAPSEYTSMNEPIPRRHTVQNHQVAGKTKRTRWTVTTSTSTANKNNQNYQKMGGSVHTAS